MADSESGASLTESGDLYSKLTGFVYIFNLIVGTGALTMPAAFQDAGWLISLITIVILSFMSYMTVTFMTETMAISNAKIHFYKLVMNKEECNESVNTEILEADVNERQPLLQERNNGRTVVYGKPSFEITHRVEMGSMAFMYFNKAGMALFHLCIIVYLYGDLSIYAAAVPKSLRDVACTFRHNNSNCNETQLDSDPCWSQNVPVNRMDAYRIFVGSFAVLLGPFVFFNVQKTKYLQALTSIARWLSFIMMIVLASIRLGQGKGNGRPPLADFSDIPNLFGVCVYSFMCHHSLPSLITPIKNKSGLQAMVASNYVVILIFYLVLSFTGVFAIHNIQDLYTLNFAPGACDALTSVVPIEYFLALFPVFTLSTSFPIIAITLRNNLATLLMPLCGNATWKVTKLLCPLLALLPPIAVAMGTNRIEFLVGITGSYAGAGIQYVIPAVLVLLARRDILAIGGGYQHGSLFGHTFWVILTLAWAGLCIAFVTANHIMSKD